MSAPSLTIQIQPSEGSSCVYGALAARTSNDLPNGQLSLVLTITNNGASAVHLNQVTVSFVGSPSVTLSSIAADLTIASMQTTQWYFGTANNIILPVPAPGTINVALSCDGFSAPATVNMPLVSYVSSVPGGGYAFPGKTGDLNAGEYWTGVSAAHGPAGGGTQLFAYDLLIRHFDPSTGTWPTVKPGTDNTKNDNYYIWGKPIYAMADGVVKEFKDGVAANTPPGFPPTTPNPVEGNHFYIQHGDDLALYAHFQAGTLNPALTSGPNPGGTGASVTKGQLLGLAGNTGNSSEPHLHIQVNRTTVPWGGPPRPLPFNDIYVLDLTDVDPNAGAPNLDSPWAKVSGQDLPNVLSAIWPGPLLLGRRIFWGRFQVLAWAWIIIIGALMFTPGGVECIACGPTLNKTLGVGSIVLRALGLISRAFFGPAAATQRVTLPQSQVKGDMHSTSNQLPR